MATGRLRPTDPVDAPTNTGDGPELGARIHIDVTIPRTSIKGRMRLVGRAEALSITSETRKLFKAAGLLDDQGRVVGIASDDWNAEIAVRYLAVAVRDPKNESKPLDSLEEWRECDDDQIEGLWSEYRDHREKVDPLGDGNAALSAEDFEMLEVAVKKKESALLMSFGSRKLSTYILSLAERPAISPTPKSGPG